MIALLAALLAVSSPAPAQATCSEPNRPPRAVKLATPIDPPEAVKEKLQATVEVLVRLADDGTVRVATAAKGPTILHASAEDAARRTIYAPEIKDCVQHGGLYVFTVEYDYRQGAGPRPSASP